MNAHNGLIPRDFWLRPDERMAILAYERKHPDEGYRRLTYMMMDEDVVAVSPSSVYRVLKEAGRMERWNGKASLKGTGFVQPTKPHEHWHVDITYINVRGTFYYLCTVLDGYSRSIVAWDIGERMTEADVGLILQRAHERYPEAHPRIISDNGLQFIAKDFKELVKQLGMTHVRTSPYYPQSNGKIERCQGTMKKEAIRPKTPLDEEETRQVVTEFVTRYNERRLHSGIGYVTPADKLAGRAEAIHAERDRKLAAAREARRKASA